MAAELFLDFHGKTRHGRFADQNGKHVLPFVAMPQHNGIFHVIQLRFHTRGTESIQTGPFLRTIVDKLLNGLAKHHDGRIRHVGRKPNGNVHDGVGGPIHIDQARAGQRAVGKGGHFARGGQPGRGGDKINLFHHPMHATVRARGTIDRVNGNAISNVVRLSDKYHENAFKLLGDSGSNHKGKGHNQGGNGTNKDDWVGAQNCKYDAKEKKEKDNVDDFFVALVDVGVVLDRTLQQTQSAIHGVDRRHKTDERNFIVNIRNEDLGQCCSIFFFLGSMAPFIHPHYQLLQIKQIIRVIVH
mmetsp:Transcript_15177/g.33203  ORF Transcript_15177/g.33203 Transcript_15177/m.33203 type:complete len:299 (-) Transcript_15177:1968-2864(-)